MRLLAISDIHLEFDPGFKIPETDGDYDVAVLAGDIHHSVAKALRWIANEREHGSIAGRPVIYVPGNHEFYRGQIGPAPVLREAGLAAELGIELLAPGTAVAGGARFVGATLWTDYALLGNAAAGMAAADASLNDRRMIEWREGLCRRPFAAREALRLHRRDRAFVEEVLATPFDGPTIVVTHHGPHPGSVAPRHRGSTLSPAFSSDLGETILRFGPELWIHGHDHNSHDYRVGRTRVVSNQAGYPTHFGTRENPGFDPGFIIEVAAATNPQEKEHGQKGNRRAAAPRAGPPTD